jgi:hypothetical protein
MSRMSERKKFLQQQVTAATPPQTEGGIVLGQAPTPKQMQQIAQAQVDRNCLGVAQAIFNQVISQVLATQDEHQQLTHEKVKWIAEQCKAVSPYIMAEFGMLEMDSPLPSEATSEAQLPTEDGTAQG